MLLYLRSTIVPVMTAVVCIIVLTRSTIVLTMVIIGLAIGIIVLTIHDYCTYIIVLIMCINVCTVVELLLPLVAVA